jgi:hypothetical protein
MPCRHRQVCQTLAPRMASCTWPCWVVRLSVWLPVLLPPLLRGRFCAVQVYEYDRNLLQQDAVQYIAAYKYEVTTISTALNMHMYVRARTALLRKPPRGVTGSAGGLFAPKPGAAAPRRGGFSVANVLNAVSQGVSVQQQQPVAPQQQRAPMRTPPRSPSGEHCRCPLVPAPRPADSSRAFCAKVISPGCSL